jgi:hypothetical protein
MALKLWLSAGAFVALTTHLDLKFFGGKSMTAAMMDFRLYSLFM